MLLLLIPKTVGAAYLPSHRNLGSRLFNLHYQTVSRSSRPFLAASDDQKMSANAAIRPHDRLFGLFKSSESTKRLQQRSRIGLSDDTMQKNLLTAAHMAPALESAQKEQNDIPRARQTVNGKKQKRKLKEVAKEATVQCVFTLLATAPAWVQEALVGRRRSR